MLEGDEPDVHNDVDGVRQELQGELGLEEGVNLLHMVRDVLADVLRKQNKAKMSTRASGRINRSSAVATKAELVTHALSLTCESVPCGTGEK